MSFVPLISVEKTNPIVSLGDHLSQLMQAYSYDQNDLNENRAGRVTERQTQAMKGVQSTKIGVLLIILVILIALPLLSGVTSAIPPETIVVSAIFVPILGIVLLVQLFRRASPGQGRVMQVEGHLRLDPEATLRTGATTYNYLQLVTGSGMLHRYHRIGLLRRSVLQWNLIHSDIFYRVYYYESRSLSYILSLEPLAAQSSP